MKKRWFILMAVMMTAGSISGTVSAEEMAEVVTEVAAAETEEAAEAVSALTKVGELPDESGEIQFAEDMIYAETDGQLQVYSLTGDKVEAGLCDKIEYVDGFYRLTKNAEEGSVCALYSKEGEELIGFEATQIVPLSDRYIKVYHAEDVQIYDLEAGQYVPNIKMTSRSPKVFACGDSLKVIDETVPQGIYDSEGNMLADGTVNYEVYGDCYYAEIDGMHVLFDDQMNRIYENENQLSPLKAANFTEDYSGYFTYTDYSEDDRPLYLITPEGNEIKTSFKSIFASSVPGLFTATTDLTDENGEHYFTVDLMWADGEVVTGGMYKSISEIGPGLFMGTGLTEKKEVMFAEDEVIISEISDRYDVTYGLAYEYETSAETYYVQEEQAYTLELAHSEPIARYLVTDQDEESRLYALFDTVTGEQLLDYEYTFMTAVDDYIYAYKDGVYEIYYVNE